MYDPGCLVKNEALVVIETNSLLLEKMSSLRGPAEHIERANRPSSTDVTYTVILKYNAKYEGTDAARKGDGKAPFTRSFNMLYYEI